VQEVPAQHAAVQSQYSHMQAAAAVASLGGRGSPGWPQQQHPLDAGLSCTASVVPQPQPQAAGSELSMPAAAHPAAHSVAATPPLLRTHGSHGSAAASQAGPLGPWASALIARGSSQAAWPGGGAPWGAEDPGAATGSGSQHIKSEGPSPAIDSGSCSVGYAALVAMAAAVAAGSGQALAAAGSGGGGSGGGGVGGLQDDTGQEQQVSGRGKSRTETKTRHADGGAAAPTPSPLAHPPCPSSQPAWAAHKAAHQAHLPHVCPLRPCLLTCPSPPPSPRLGRFRQDDVHARKLVEMGKRCAAMFDGAIADCFEVGRTAGRQGGRGPTSAPCACNAAPSSIRRAHGAEPCLTRP
jgi:hypothetical protein